MVEEVGEKGSVAGKVGTGREELEKGVVKETTGVHMEKGQGFGRSRGERVLR